MSTPYIGQLRLVAFNFAPRGYALCNGQLLPINQYQALFALLGTTYGGNGVSTFALPNLQSRVAISSGNGYTLGGSAGTENVTLDTAQMPAHTHTLTVSKSGNQTSKTPAGFTVGVGAGGTNPYATATNGTMSTSALSQTGGNQPHENRSPYLVLNWVIALTGIFPSRS
jgi:microcystin-dependent protein